MQRGVNLLKINVRLTHEQSLLQLGFCSQVITGRLSPIVFPERRGQGKISMSRDANVSNTDLKKEKWEEHKINIGDEKSDLLGYEVFAGQLAFDKRKAIKISGTQSLGEMSSQDYVGGKLTSKAMVWGSQMLYLQDIISVSHCPGFRHFTVHSYPRKKGSFGFSCFMRTQRSRKDYRFFASSSDEALKWISAFADQQCYVNFLTHPVSSGKQNLDLIVNDFLPESYIKCKSPPKLLVILNPRSGRGRSSKVFHGTVEPIFKLAGFKMEIVKTTCAGHARKLAASFDFSTCPDGIICVGGDGIVNEVLNGLLTRDYQKEAISIPIGIIPAGSDNSLVWTVLGVRDPVSAAIAIVKGGLTAVDVFAVEWVQSGIIHFGMIVSYFGFISDVLGLSERFQKQFGPLRYFIAGFLKFLCLPKYNFEVEYLPASKDSTEEEKSSVQQEIINVADLYTDIMRRSSKEGLPRASSLSSIDSVKSPIRTSKEIDATCGNTEPSEYVRAIDPKSKRLSAGRSNLTTEPEVIHSPLPHSGTPNWPRTRSKSRSDKGWAGLISTDDPTKNSWGNTVLNDKEDISSTISDPGPLWDAEPRWDAEPNCDAEDPLDDTRDSLRKEINPTSEEKWVVRKGQFLAVLACNHSCKTVQSLSSQVVAPNAKHDDHMLDLVLVHGCGRLKLLRFFLLLQMGRHLSLPYVEYVKVKSVRIKPGKQTNSGCGIDGELFPVNGQVVSSLFPEQCQLIGRAPNNNK